MKVVVWSRKRVAGGRKQVLGGAGVCKRAVWGSKNGQWVLWLKPRVMVVVLAVVITQV